MNFASRIPAEVRPLLEMLERSQDAVFVTDQDNYIVSWNMRCKDLLGFAPEDAVGASCAALMEGCDGSGNRYCSQHCPLLDMARRGEVVRHFDLKLKRGDLPCFYVDITILHVPAPLPHQFYLAHILKPSDRTTPGAQPEMEDLAPPRPLLLNVRDSPDARARKLTQREIEILGLVAAGRVTGEIAELLNISTLTVRNHTQNILEKLEVHSKAEAVAFAFQKRLL